MPGIWSPSDEEDSQLTCSSGQDSQGQEERLAQGGLRWQETRKEEVGLSGEPGEEEEHNREVEAGLSCKPGEERSDR